MSAPTYEGHLFLDRIESDSMIHLESMEERRKQVEGIVKIIRLQGRVGRADGHWSEGYGITHSWSMARDCYIVALLTGTIHFASTAVECAINNDTRIKPYRDALSKWQEKNGHEPDGWLTLSRSNLAKAKCAKLPVAALLNPDESVEDKSKEIVFIARRNKIAHGDYRIYNLFMDADYGLGKPVLNAVINVDHKSALDQFIKCSNFLKAWTNQKPQVDGFFAYDDGSR